MSISQYTQSQTPQEPDPTKQPEKIFSWAQQASTILGNVRIRSFHADNGIVFTKEDPLFLRMFYTIGRCIRNFFMHTDFYDTKKQLHLFADVERNFDIKTIIDYTQTHPDEPLEEIKEKVSKMYDSIISQCKKHHISPAIHTKASIENMFDSVLLDKACQKYTNGGIHHSSATFSFAEGPTVHSMYNVLQECIKTYPSIPPDSIAERLKIHIFIQNEVQTYIQAHEQRKDLYLSWPYIEAMIKNIDDITKIVSSNTSSTVYQTLITAKTSLQTMQNAYSTQQREDLSKLCTSCSVLLQQFTQEPQLEGKRLIINDAIACLSLIDSIRGTLLPGLLQQFQPQITELTQQVASRHSELAIESSRIKTARANRLPISSTTVAHTIVSSHERPHHRHRQNIIPQSPLRNSLPIVESLEASDIQEPQQHNAEQQVAQHSGASFKSRIFTYGAQACAHGVSGAIQGLCISIFSLTPSTIVEKVSEGFIIGFLSSLPTSMVQETVLHTNISGSTKEALCACAHACQPLVSMGMSAAHAQYMAHTYTQISPAQTTTQTTLSSSQSPLTQPQMSQNTSSPTLMQTPSVDISLSTQVPIPNVAQANQVQQQPAASSTQSTRTTILLNALLKFNPWHKDVPKDPLDIL